MNQVKGIIVLIGILLVLIIVRTQCVINDLHDELDEKDDRIAELQNKVTELQHEIKEIELGRVTLEDSLKIAYTTIDSLNRRIEALNETIEDIVTQIQRKDGIIEELQKHKIPYSATEKERNILKEKLKKLQEEKNKVATDQVELIKEKDIYKKKTMSLKTVQDSLKKIITSKEATLEQHKLKAIIDSIVYNTEVELKQVILKDKGNDRITRRIKSGSNKWKYSEFTLQLNHPDKKRLFEGKKFAALIRDMNGNAPLYHKEKQGGKDNYWIPIDDPLLDKIIIAHSNYEAKAGKDYRLEFFLLHEGQEYKLANGSIQFIENGRFMKIYK